MTDHQDVDHEPPGLLGLLTGELSRDETLAAARHLETCQACTRELIDLAVAQAALRNADRVDRMLAESTEPLPPLRAPLDEPDHAPTGPARRHPGRRPPWLWAAAAVIVLLVAAGAFLAVAGRRGSTAVESARLRTIKAPAGASGSVAVFARGSTRTLQVRARDLPDPASHYFYEVWLLDPTTQKMLPMGVLSPSGGGQYSVSANIMDGYSAVDISLQANNGDPAHSQTSVMRAYL